MVLSVSSVAKAECSDLPHLSSVVSVQEDESASENSSSEDEGYKRRGRRSTTKQKPKKGSSTRGRGTKSSRSVVDYTEKGSDEDVGCAQFV